MKILLGVGASAIAFAAIVGVPRKTLGMSIKLKK